MSAEQNKSIAREIFAALNAHDLDKVATYYAPDCRFNGWGPQTLDTSGYKMAMSDLLTAFPDAHFVIDDLIAEGDSVAIRHHLQGSHQAAFQGIPATGKAVVINAIAIIHMANGQATDLVLNADFMGLMQQLGVIPA